MKILLYKGLLKLVLKSGVGRAIYHQQKALEQNHIPYTSNKKDSYDVIQLNTIFPDSAAAAIAARLKGKKVVYYAHSTMEDFKNSFKGSNIFAPVFKRWIKFCYNLGDIIITPTEYSKNLLLKYELKKPIIALSNGIDLSYFTKSTEGAERFREKYNLPIKQKVVISVGHYIERKGINDFIELAKRMSDVTFIWFGYTNLNLVPNNISKAIASAPPNVKFPGYVCCDELRDAYSGSNLFLFLTHEETEGIVILEALAMQIPILVRDIPIYKQLFIEGKEVYKANSLDEFQDNIEKILDGRLPSLQLLAYNAVKQKDIKFIGDKLRTIYEELERSSESLALKNSYHVNRSL